MFDDKPTDSSVSNDASSKRTILFCEDTDMVRDAIQKALVAQGYRVLPARHGEEALQVAEAHPEPVDLLVTDVAMPNMSGRELANALRARDVGLKVLFVSGFTSDVLNLQGGEASGEDFLQKPFGPGVFLDRVKKLLDS